MFVHKALSTSPRENDLQRYKEVGCLHSLEQYEAPERCFHRCVVYLPPRSMHSLPDHKIQRWRRMTASREYPSRTGYFPRFQRPHDRRRASTYFMNMETIASGVDHSPQRRILRLIVFGCNRLIHKSRDNDKQ
uniref:Alpha/beta hydrolase-thioesterase n=1 Tax=Paenibacillus polymyxa TaxID=1406 RepID=D1FNL9_PAEPO|nr:alpha/beta hydrolase-thioesterase [Paenibacillus polymyxa SC2]